MREILLGFFYTLVSGIAGALAGALVLIVTGNFYYSILGFMIAMTLILAYFIYRE